MLPRKNCLAVLSIGDAPCKVGLFEDDIGFNSTHALQSTRIAGLSIHWVSQEPFTNFKKSDAHAKATLVNGAFELMHLCIRRQFLVSIHLSQLPAFAGSSG